MQTAEGETTSILNDALGLIRSLDDRVLPYINSTVDELNTAKARLNELYAVADGINANVTRIEEIRTALLDRAGDSAVADSVPQGELTRVTPEQLKALDEGRWV